LKKLEWSEALAMAAKDHCDDTGPAGRVGDTGADGSSTSQRVARYGVVDSKVDIAQSIAYGTISGAEYMRQLYIDDGVPSRRDRVNMRDETMKYTGMHACEHAKRRGMIVVVYAAGKVVPNKRVPAVCPDSNTGAAAPNSAAVAA